MKPSTQIVAALLVVCFSVGGIVYASRDSHSRDHFGCHRHGATTYHCH